MPSSLKHTVVPFSCDRCGLALRAALAMAGRQTTCPVCQVLLVVPPPPPAPQATLVVSVSDLEDTFRFGSPPAVPQPG